MSTTYSKTNAINVLNLTNNVNNVCNIINVVDAWMRSITSPKVYVIYANNQYKDVIVVQIIVHAPNVYKINIISNKINV